MPDTRTMKMESADASPASAFDAERHPASAELEAREAPRDRDSEARESPQTRSEEHTSELQSRRDLVCRLLLEKKKKKKINTILNNLTRAIETNENISGCQ